ncbi:MAG: hypothetical protein LEGION0398_MBIBDBAK_00167 [Legionellaceae bacterium]
MAKIKYVVLVSSLLASLLPWVSFAKDTQTYYDAHAKGWHWYDDPAPKKEKIESEVEEKIQTAEETLHAVRAKIKESLAKAILEPTDTNVARYIANQNAMTERAHQFSKAWQKALWQHPELDTSIINPTNSVATKIYHQEKEGNVEKAIRALSKQSGLFFFYRSTCPYCQQFAPILKAFGERYGLSIIPITTDGISLPEFPNSLIDKGQSKKFHVEVEPSLFAVNPYTHKAYPIAYGLVTEDNLKQRIYDIATNFEVTHE